MKLLNIFKRSNDDQKIIDAFRKSHQESAQELISTLCHHDNEILASALFKAVTLINLMDPNRSFVVQESDLINQEESELVDLTYLFIDMANSFYKLSNSQLDSNPSKHIH
tara:strand:- start:69 stop:398 length:330 start_codon:yes stop_codon:yes gene_type:complete